MGDTRCIHCGATADSGWLEEGIRSAGKYYLPAELSIFKTYVAVCHCCCRILTDQEIEEIDDERDDLCGDRLRAA
jgi:hypothetical protein